VVELSLQRAREKRWLADRLFFHLAKPKKSAKRRIHPR